MIKFLDKELGVGWRDTAERLVRTGIAVGLGALVPILTELPNWWAAPAVIVANWLLLKVSQKTPLPSPGEGLPGLPTEVPPDGM